MGRKQTSQAALEALPLPGPSALVAKILNNKGGGNYEVALPNTVHSATVSMPQKFRNVVWVKRGSYVLVELGGEESRAARVDGEILHVLMPDQVKHIKNQGLWPSEFMANGHASGSPTAVEASREVQSGSEDSDNDDDLFVNTNRRVETDNESDDE
ncbi:uncharacterized protein EV422DRAFT_545955 [Fimicolochytrium jonesii]|uniref:uncharacterized protein n=1 Tax=Fimicolochytrium jonesii TaxID=1396493 RepID=UPI0022FEFF18|nr:uncharacterized protein EV422DRAFT_545955 [Fimicolochytrium jonesii]KAI8816423.1 hypothetical protein EV422DRAFT_545955 [Fimicolochytrium jonesii]